MGDITREAIEKIETLVKKGQILDVNGRKFSAVPLDSVDTTVQAETIELHTLAGLCAFINDNRDNLDYQKFFVIVNAYNKVLLTSTLYGEDRVRETIVSVKLDGELKVFPFGTFLNQEEFVIRFRSLIARADDDDYEYVLGLVSKLATGNSLSMTDDGMSQEVNVKRGMSGALKCIETARPIVRLAPYRTFRDIVQPASDFLLRFRQTDDGVPCIGLFEADGGVWRNAAVKSIADFIREHAPVEVVA